MSYAMPDQPPPGAQFSFPAEFIAAAQARGVTPEILYRQVYQQPQQQQYAQQPSQGYAQPAPAETGGWDPVSEFGREKGGLSLPPQAYARPASYASYDYGQQPAMEMTAREKEIAEEKRQFSQRPAPPVRDPIHLTSFTQCCGGCLACLAGVCFWCVEIVQLHLTHAAAFSRSK